MADVNPRALDALMMKMLGDMGATLGGALVLMGDELGLYKALAPAPLTVEALAKKTGTNERLLREWLATNAAAGYVECDPRKGTYWLTPEQNMAFADEGSPYFVGGFYQIAAAAYADEPKVREALKSGKGVGWHEHCSALFAGTERFFRAAYAHQLVQEWIPALAGVKEKLEKGARVADVGCGHGASTILMAKAFPSSQFVGFDYHQGSIERARRSAEEAGVADHCRFEVGSAKDYPGTGYDLVGFFDCLHDMGDPVGAGRHVRETLDPEGTWLVVEPRAGDTLAENMNPIGRLFYGASTLFCVPASQNQEVGAALGAQAGEAKLCEVMRSAGFTRVRRAAETPFNLILEARP